MLLAGGRLTNSNDRTTGDLIFNRILLVTALVFQQLDGLLQYARMGIYAGGSVPQRNLPKARKLTGVFASA